MELTDQEKELLRIMIDSFECPPNFDRSASRSLFYKLQVELDGPPAYDEPRITNLEGPGIGNDLVTSFKGNK